ncbi:RCC1/BLIP-II [Trichodelitschia bisporula]|uniref:RCC1/BLIP-II n=1 Tax=Trichodelitschia bisporula TaxID=703511 RepID=A0A6G1HRJ5_9PEZI|nr:RCC1/BLIP-II [Trichodelitschia bisporula]
MELRGLYALGSNGSGQLGLGHKDDRFKPIGVTHLPAGEDPSEWIIVAGGNHTLALSKSEQTKIYACGQSGDGRCIFDHTLGSPSWFCFAESCPLVGCAATWEATILARGDDGGVVSFGTGNKGELGLGPAISLSTGPSRIPNFPPPGTAVVHIAAGMSHCVAVLSNGEVYGWGSGRKGQLGHPAVNCWSPRKIEGISFRATRAVCGRDFTYIVGEPVEGNHAVFGSDKWSLVSRCPPRVAGWKDIGAGWGAIYVLLESGELISWGRDNFHQLSPLNLPKITQFAAGSEHVIAATEDGRVIAWGWGEHGNCGMEDWDDMGDWNTLMSGAKVKNVFAGCATSWITIE